MKHTAIADAPVSVVYRRDEESKMMEEEIFRRLARKIVSEIPFDELKKLIKFEKRRRSGLPWPDAVPAETTNDLIALVDDSHIRFVAEVDTDGRIQDCIGYVTNGGCSCRP